MGKIIKKGGLQQKGAFIDRPRMAEIIPEGTGGVLNKKVLDAKEKAEAIINEAIIDAERIRLSAKAVLDQVNLEMERAKKRGYDVGHDEAFASVTEQMVKISEIRSQFYSNAEPEIIKLVMMIAEKVIGKMVREQEGAIKSIVRQAVDSSLGERITVKLNPEDYKIVTADKFEFKDIFDRSKRIAFKEDETINKGGCIVETEVGTIDARLETQLKAIKKALEL